MKLTEIYDERSEKGAKQTMPGMAFWAGTGPAGKTCRGCRFHDSPGKYTSGMRAGAPKPGSCLKYKQIMRIKGAPIRHEMRACKYFEAR